MAEHQDVITQLAMQVKALQEGMQQDREKIAILKAALEEYCLLTESLRAYDVPKKPETKKKNACLLCRQP
jgi:hypothetical protein